MMRMKQKWLDIDYCDNCGTPIPEGAEIYLDVEYEYAGVIPAYCRRCAGVKVHGKV